VNLKSGDVRRATGPTVVSFHHVNAYEQDDGKGGLQIVMDVCTIDPNNIGKTQKDKPKGQSNRIFFVKPLFATLWYKSSDLLLNNY
jgi:hypothetical protein